MKFQTFPLKQSCLWTALFEVHTQRKILGKLYWPHGILQALKKFLSTGVKTILHWSFQRIWYSVRRETFSNISSLFGFFWEAMHKRKMFVVQVKKKEVGPTQYFFLVEWKKNYSFKKFNFWCPRHL